MKSSVFQETQKGLLQPPSINNFRQVLKVSLFLYPTLCSKHGSPNLSYCRIVIKISKPLWCQARCWKQQSPGKQQNCGKLVLVTPCLIPKGLEKNFHCRNYTRLSLRTYILKLPRYKVFFWVLVTFGWLDRDWTENPTSIQTLSNPCQRSVQK